MTDALVMTCTYCGLDVPLPGDLEPLVGGDLATLNCPCGMESRDLPHIPTKREAVEK